MKGGIASGVVYPSAISELSHRYRLRSVGGASAGAIAAAAAAAAEYGREGGGFERLRQMSSELQVSGFIGKLFQPSSVARAPYDLALSFVAAAPAGRTRWRQIREAPWPEGVPQSLAVGAFACALPGMVVAIVLMCAGKAGHEMSCLSCVVLAVALLLCIAASGCLGAVVGTAAGLWYHVLKPTRDALSREESFGFCSGMGPNDDSSEGLTQWLCTWFDRLAGRSTCGPALTFAHLAAKSDVRKRPASIKLRLVATNLSRRQPFTIPLQSGHFLFKESEFRQLFPSRVVEQLIAWSAQMHSTDVQIPVGYHRLPIGDDLPVIVGVRLSLSFPVLLKAVCLYTIPGRAFANSRAKTKKRTEDQLKLEPNWISDGGIASNFPIHLFDEWMPSRPTFGITLEPVGVKIETIRLPKPKEFERGQPVTRNVRSTAEFGAAIFDTAQSFRDNAQISLPGYRERVVQIRLSAAEGGLNLQMEGATLDSMVDKGARAGRALRDSFCFDEHRWVRSMAILARLEEELEGLLLEHRDGGAPAAAARSAYAELMRRQIAAQEKKDLSWYRPRDREWCDEAERRVGALISLAEAWGQDPNQALKNSPPLGVKFFRDDEPKPHGVLRIMPR